MTPTLKLHPPKQASKPLRLLKHQPAATTPAKAVTDCSLELTIVSVDHTIGFVTVVKEDRNSSHRTLDKPLRELRLCR